MTYFTRNYILGEMKVSPEIDVEQEICRRVGFIKNQLLSSQSTTLVLGISGGIDSATTGKLAQIAIDKLKGETGKPYQFIAIRLPYKHQQDEADAQASLDFISPDRVLNINIQAGTDGIYSHVIAALESNSLLPLNGFDFAKGNVKARMRMIAQYQVAGMLNGLVLGTDHSAENVTGFYTKYGDGACDLAPLFGLSKRQVRQLAKMLGAPQSLIDKVPTADLESMSPGKPDEQALGLSYEQIDDFLEGRLVDTAIEEKILRIYRQTHHKRQTIPTVYG